MPGTEAAAYSPDGSTLALATAEGISFVDTQTGECGVTIAQIRIQAINFSPKGNYLLTWHKPANEEDGE